MLCREGAEMWHKKIKEICSEIRKEQILGKNSQKEIRKTVLGLPTDNGMI